MQQKQPRPTTIFSICAPSDSDTMWLKRWEAHLHPLEQAGVFSVWSVSHLQAGTDRFEILLDHLAQADIIVLLLSADFFTDDECCSLMERALLRHHQGKMRLIPLLLRPVPWRETPIGLLTPLPSNTHPVTQWQDPEAAFDDCVRELRRIRGLPMIPQQRRPVVEEQDRVRMLQRLRRSYSELMSQSLQGVALLELGMVSKPDAVQNASNLLLRINNRPDQPLPPGISITEAYDEAAHELLILGEPGAGKSTLLLDLAQQLVGRAEQDAIHPLPVMLPFSSWAIKHLPLQEWIAEQLAEIYDIPRTLSVRWVQEGNILPLLDGLDEMKEAAREAGIVAINTYHRDHLAPLIVCSRISEYQAAAERHRLILQGAVVIQPLTHKHVDTYLIQAGRPLAALRRTLKKNATLHDLATTPLMLNILVLTYQGVSLPTLSTEGPLLLHQVWDDYLQRMVSHKGSRKRYSLSQTQAWLSWLGQQMRNHNQTIFYLEHLQPDWLSTKQQRVYAALAVRLPALIIGSLMGIVAGLFFSLDGFTLSIVLHYAVMGAFLEGLWHGSVSKKETLQEHPHAWGKQLVRPLAVSACIGFIYWLIFGCYFYTDPTYTLHSWLTYSLSYSIMIAGAWLLLQYLFMFTRSLRPRAFSENNASRQWQWMRNFFQKVQGLRALLVAVVIWLSFGLGGGLGDLLSGKSGELVYQLGDGLSGGLGIGLSYAFISLIFGTQIETIHIHLAERVRWAWRGLFTSRHLRITVLLTCICIIYIGLSNGLNSALHTGLNYGLNNGLNDGLGIGLSFWFIFGLIQGVTQERIEDQDRRTANQGIHRSLRNSIIMGIIGGGVVGSVEILIDVLSDGLNGVDPGSIFFIFFISIISALLICMVMDRLAVWRHFVVRSLLWHARTFPMLAPQFLDDATARFLLRRIGGGYQFAHRLLLDHLADGVERGTELH